MAQLSKKDFNKKIAVMRENNERLKILHEIREERELYSPKVKKQKTKISNIALFTSIIAIVSFTIACLIIQACTGAEVSPTLTTSWYTFWTVEIGVLAGIKVTKVIKDTPEDDSGAAG